MNGLGRVSPNRISELADDEIFVFGSNLDGLHYGGAARTALQWGAVMGQGVGLSGKTYAIPTMFGSVSEIRPYVDAFIDFARQHPGLRFLVTEIGCGIAGFRKEQIAPLFKAVLLENIPNIFLPAGFLGLLEPNP